MRRLLRPALWGALACASAAVASTVQVTNRDCGRVELVAQEAPLAAVLDRLATVLAFRLEVEGELTGTVRMHATAPPRELLAHLLQAQQGHVVWYTRDPHCPQHPRVARVRLIAGAAGAALSQAAPLSRTRASAQAQRVPVTETATPQRLREVEREAQRRKAQYEAHVRRHGEPPPGEPEEAANQ